LGSLGDAFAELNKTDFPYHSPPYEGMKSVRNWCENNRPDCPPDAATYDITRLFTEVGTYTIYIMVDSVAPFDLPGQPYGNVQEAENPGELGEADNVYQFTVDITTPCPPEGCGPPPGNGNPTIFLPLIGQL
jgi:hypothetical protein